MMKLVLCAALALSGAPAAFAEGVPEKGIASWYGESHRGRLMANGRKFNPDRLTAASWFYPLGTRVKVTLHQPKSKPSKKAQTRTVYVTITDRGPAHYLVRGGRIIDLAEAAFERLADLDLGLVQVTVKPVKAVSVRTAAYSNQPGSLKKAA